jgi:hypothetical protein
MYSREGHAGLRCCYLAGNGGLTPIVEQLRSDPDFYMEKTPVAKGRGVEFSRFLALDQHALRGNGGNAVLLVDLNARARR